MKNTFANALAATIGLALFLSGSFARAEGDWEITPDSQAALRRGLDWLAENQGPEGNWQSTDLGLVSMGALAFLADGHTPGHGKYGKNVDRALNFVLANAKPSGELNMQNPHYAMYNHGLSTFVLGQAYGMSSDPRIGKTLDAALKLIAATQCRDGGWDYTAVARDQGHDLSLAVMQAKALRSAVDSGFQVSPDVIKRAIQDVREHYSPGGMVPGLGVPGAGGARHRGSPGVFTYMKRGGGGSLAMAAAGVVCLQEFGQYDDWRIPWNMDVISQAVGQLPAAPTHNGRMNLDAYTLYYVGQAMYQVGGEAWRTGYPKLRDHLIATQTLSPGSPRLDGVWHETRFGVGQTPGDLYATSCACFVLAIPNRYLPILQEGKIKQYQQGK